MLLQFSLITFLFLPSCQAVGLGSQLLSLLTGNIKHDQSQEGNIVQVTDYAKNTVEVYNKEEVEEVEERHPKNTDIDDYDQRNSLLDTINLSYAGNVDLAQAVGKARTIGSSLAEAIGAIVDLKFVRSVVDIAIDRYQINE